MALDLWIRYTFSDILFNLIIYLVAFNVDYQMLNVKS